MFGINNHSIIFNWVGMGFTINFEPKTKFNKKYFLWAKNGERRTVSEERWTANGGRWTVNVERGTVNGDGRWSMDGGRYKTNGHKIVTVRSR